MIIGLDSWYKLGLVLDTADRTWYYQSCTEELLHVVDKGTTDSLTVRKDKEVDRAATLVELSNRQNA
jgi:hypothetical protein